MAALDDVIAAFEDRGWQVLNRAALSGGKNPNPTELDLVRRKQRLRLIVYAWKISGEGKGRSGTNYRIQTTRSHETDLINRPGWLTVGFGIDHDRQVLAAFDGWTKRATGWSSSVHIERATLDRAAETGYAEEAPRWDSRAATRLDDVDRLLPWLNAQRDTRLAAVQPLDWHVDAGIATVAADLWGAPPAAWLRPTDLLVISDGRRLVDTAIWRINADPQVTVTVPGKNPRRSVTFSCRRYGRIHSNAERLLHQITQKEAA